MVDCSLTRYDEEDFLPSGYIQKGVLIFADRLEKVLLTYEAPLIIVRRARIPGTRLFDMYLILRPSGNYSYCPNNNTKASSS